MTGFRLKAYEVYVQGYPPSVYFAATPGKARSEAYRLYSECFNITFKDFLKVSRVRIADDHARSAWFGKPIKIDGKDAFYVSGNSQYIQFVYPDSDNILNVHPMQVDPEYMRPPHYRSTDASTQSQKV